MSETNTTFPRPSEIFLDMIIAFVAPMFLSATGGDIVCARMAAIETINAYRAETQADLIAIAQIIAFGLAALSSLSRSMAEDLPLPLVLRLRANATACNRAAEQHRRARNPATPVPQTAPFEPFEPFNEDFNEATVLAALAATHERAAAADAAARAPAAAAPNPAAPNPAATIREQDYNAMWAAAAARVAGEMTADLASLTPAERRAAIIHAAALTDCANDLLAGGAGPRPRPGDLAAFTRRNRS